MDASDKIIVARTRLGKKEPFWGYLAMNMKIIEDTEGKLPSNSMGVDKTGNLYYAPEFVENLTDDELLGAILHETSHVAFDHFERGSGYNKEIYNIAADIVANDILVTSGFDLPSNGIIPSNHRVTIPLSNKEIVIREIDKKTTEDVYGELYRKLPKQDQNESGQKGESEKDENGEDNSSDSDKDEEKDDKGKGGSSNTDSNGKDKDKDNGFGISRFDSHFEEGNKAEGDKKKKDWDQILSEAAAMAKERGDVPAGVGRYIEAKLYSKLDWKALLQKYITREIPTDTTWSRPNKKSLATGGYLPDVVKEKVDVVVGFDLSGSINDDLAGEFLSECIGLSKSFESIRMTLLVHDAEVQQVIPVRNGNIKKLRKLKMKGGGGTDHRPVYEWIKKNKPNTKVLINFTDGYTAFPDKEPEFKSLWVLSPYSCSESEIEFGETVKMKEQ